MAPCPELRARGIKNEVDVNLSLIEPTEITQFSFDSNHEYQPDRSSLKNYHAPELDTDLWEGFESFDRYEESSDQHLDALLRALMEDEKRRECPTEADIIAWRGLMTKILAFPYSSEDLFEYNITWFQDSIFIEEDFDYKKWRRELQVQQDNPAARTRSEKMSYAGYKFETISTLPYAAGEVSEELVKNRLNLRVSNSEQYCSIVDTGVGDIRLVVGGEVDAIWDEYPEDPAINHPNYVELKTFVQPNGKFYSQKRFEQRLLNMWAQSSLLGVPINVIGFRPNPPGNVLREVEIVDTTEIPEMVRKKQASWNPYVCITFFNKFLKFVKAHVNRPGVWKMRASAPDGSIKLFLISEEGSGGIISEEFLKWRSAQILTK